MKYEDPTSSMQNLVKLLSKQKIGLFYARIKYLVHESPAELKINFCRGGSWTLYSIPISDVLTA